MSHKNRIAISLIQNYGKLKNESFYFDFIERYFKKKNHSDAFHVLSDKTCNDIDLQELFMFVDRTTSAVGQQFLYNSLRVIPDSQSKIIEFEELIELFKSDSEVRLKAQKQLYKLKGKDAYYITSLFQDEQIKPPRWLFFAKLLSAASIIAFILMFFNPAIAFVLFAIIVLNFGFHFWNKSNLLPYLVSIPQLLKLNTVAKELFKNKSLKIIDPELSESTAILDKVRNKMACFNFEAKLQGDMEAAASGILELVKIIFLVEPILLFSVLKQLDNKREEIERVFKFVGQVDLLISISSLRKGLDLWCNPNFISENKSYSAIEIYHPLIKDCIKNSFELSGKSVLLTGSNMSGKTSFIRTIAINVLSGLTLNTCFAKSFNLQKTRIFSAIRISDDLLNDKSYYFEEVLTIKDMIDNSLNDCSNLFLLDEIFKGTNTVERISAGKAVLSVLNRSANLVFVSTHDIELADLLIDEYELYHFSESIINETVDFDYKLKEGKLKNRNAIRILQLNGYPEEIIEEAISLSLQIDMKRRFEKENN